MLVVALLHSTPSPAVAASSAALLSAERAEQIRERADAGQRERQIEAVVLREPVAGEAAAVVERLVLDRDAAALRIVIRRVSLLEEGVAEQVVVERVGRRRGGCPARRTVVAGVEIVGRRRRRCRSRSAPGCSGAGSSPPFVCSQLPSCRCRSLPAFAACAPSYPTRCGTRPESSVGAPRTMQRRPARNGSARSVLKPLW